MKTQINRWLHVSFIVVFALVISLPLFSSQPVEAAVSGYNGRIVFMCNGRDSGTNLQICTMNPDGSDQVQLTDSIGYNYRPRWSPDGTKIAFDSTRTVNTEIYTMNSDGSNQTQLTNTPGFNNTSPSWSPDGTKLVFQSNRDGNSEIYTMNSDGTNQTRITTNTTNEYAAAFSPDGTKIAYSSNSDGNGEIYIMNSDGTNPVQLTNTTTPAGNAGVDWSPDGTKIAFYSSRDGINDVYIMNSDGTNQTRLTNTPGFRNSLPAFSPDGTKIAFTSLRDNGNYEIYTMNADGSNQVNITNNKSHDQYSDWQSLSSPLSSPSTPALPTILHYTKIGTHPEAAVQGTVYGRTINRLYAYNNKLYAGYGDYDTNTGPISIDPFDLATHSFTGIALTLQTDELNNFRLINNKLYTTTIDPKGTTGGFGSGEPWQAHVTITGSLHNFDITTFNGTDLWVSGAVSGGNGIATAWRSQDGGVTWTVERSNASGRRYYWVLTLGGKLYLQGSEVNSPVEIFDGTTWSTGTTDAVAYGNEHPIIFKNKIISGMKGLSTFDGTTVSKVSSFNGAARGYYVDGDYLYVLRTNNTVARTTDLNTWQELGVGPSNSASIAVYNDHVYIGGEGDAAIYESSPISLVQFGGSGSELADTGLNQLALMFTSTTTIIGLAAYLLRSKVSVRSRSRY